MLFIPNHTFSATQLNFQIREYQNNVIFHLNVKAVHLSRLSIKHAFLMGHFIINISWYSKNSYCVLKKND